MHIKLEDVKEYYLHFNFLNVQTKKYNLIEAYRLLVVLAYHHYNCQDACNVKLSPDFLSLILSYANLSKFIWLDF